VERTPRFYQVCGKFDLPTDATSVREWNVDLTLPDEWSVGVIVGPSMAGKTTIARELFGADSVVDAGYWPWPAGKCIADGFPDGMGIDEITGLLSAVGFSSPPDWKKPHGALSNGGKFRVDLARTLAERPELAVVDEFGSLVHQQARQVAAAAAAKAVRRRGGKLVALCVHPDAVEYFEPDWIIDMIPGEIVRCQAVRGSVRRPPIQLEIARVNRKAWDLFRHHHYLDHAIHASSKCFVAFVDGQPAAFTAVLPFPHAVKPGWREHRTVCHPDYQGIGLGNRMSEYVASLFRATGKPYMSTTSHPAMIKYRARSPVWAVTRKPGIVSGSAGPKSNQQTGLGRTLSTGRITAGFQYVGPARPEEARKFGVVKCD
jgi:GNAT superfamily N-acetyltransferase